MSYIVKFKDETTAEVEQDKGKKLMNNFDSLNSFQIKGKLKKTYQVEEILPKSEHLERKKSSRDVDEQDPTEPYRPTIIRNKKGYDKIQKQTFDKSAINDGHTNNAEEAMDDETIRNRRAVIANCELCLNGWIKSKERSMQKCECVITFDNNHAYEA